MTAIEQKYIKGMTVKLFISIIVSTTTICSTVMYIYYDFKTSLTMTTMQSTRALQETLALRKSDSVQNNSINYLTTAHQLDSIRLGFLYLKTHQ